jgi:hypothetical protein
MRIIAVFSNPAHCRIEYIKLINPATSQVVTLDWDESEVSDEGLYGKGVHINYPEKDESENETYGNGRMSELKGMIFSEAQFYNPDEDKECTEIFIDSVIIEDNGEYLQILLGTKTNN